MSVVQALRLLISFGAVLILSIGVMILFFRFKPYFEKAWLWIENNTDISVSEELKTAIIGGIVGGIAFAAVSPAFAPVMYDAQVRSGLVQEPEPDISIQYSENASYSAAAFGEPVTEDHWVFTVTIQNPGRRVTQDFSLNLMFGGEVEDRAFKLTGFHFVANNEVEFGHDYSGNQSVNFASISTDELPPGRIITVQYLVDMDPDGNYSRAIVGMNTSGSNVVVSSVYNWQYNGRVYTEATGFESRTVDPVPTAEPVNSSRSSRSLVTE